MVTVNGVQLTITPTTAKPLSEFMISKSSFTLATSRGSFQTNHPHQMNNMHARLKNTSVKEWTPSFIKLEPQIKAFVMTAS